MEIDQGGSLDDAPRDNEEKEADDHHEANVRNETNVDNVASVKGEEKN